MKRKDWQSVYDILQTSVRAENCPDRVEALRLLLTTTLEMLLDIHEKMDKLMSYRETK